MIESLCVQFCLNFPSVLHNIAVCLVLEHPWFALDIQLHRRILPCRYHGYILSLYNRVLSTRPSLDIYPMIWFYIVKLTSLLEVSSDV